MLDCNRIRILGWVVCFLFALPNCYSQYSLRKELTEAGIPLTSFSKAELDEIVDGVSADKGQYVYFAYLRTKGEMLTGFPLLLRYDQKTDTILRSELQLDEKDDCCGSPDGIEFVDDYLLLQFHYNPSAASVVVLNNKLKMTELFYGFGSERIAPYQIVMIEGMMHFAPVHPERLKYLDLQTGNTKEFYPLKGDAIRAQFVQDNGKRMPRDEVCEKVGYGSCDPELFDEDIDVLGSDGNGRFALLANLDASYPTPLGEGTSGPNLQRSVLYLYELGNSGWKYCDVQIIEKEAEEIEGIKYKERNGENGMTYNMVKGRCNPNRAVEPDMSTSDFSPFPVPRRLIK